MTLSTLDYEAVTEEDSTQSTENTQSISKSRRIEVSKGAWIARIIMFFVLMMNIGFNVFQSFESNNSLLVYSSLMSIHTIMIFSGSWFFFKCRVMGEVPDDQVSVIIPIYNQESMIENVIDAIYASSYKNLEVIAVNDGSEDGTKQVLESLANKYDTLKVIHKENGGKRRAVASGFYASKGRYIVLMDSDCLVDRNAIKEFMKTFVANPTVGAVTGYGKVLNSEENILTKCQDAWYDYAFNIHKTFESIFGCVLCCSGCLSAYRREAIAAYIPYWIQSRIHNSDDRDLTSYALATPWAKKELAPVSKKLFESMAQYDDSEDRGLTAQALCNWETVYVPTAIVYTEVPNNLKKYLRQQTRWKKGYLRSNFYVSAFFWRKHPIMSMKFYTELMTTFTAPLIIFAMYFYAPFVLGKYWLTLSYIMGQLLIGLIAGLDYKFRSKKEKNWIYKPLMNLFSSVVISWMLFPALITYKKNQWLTR